jgi:hypothetical protein
VNELLEKLQLAMQEAGGKVTYPAFHATLSYQEQQLLPRVIRLGKQNGVLKQYVVWDAEAKDNTHYLEAVTP